MHASRHKTFLIRFSRKRGEGYPLFRLWGWQCVRPVLFLCAKIAIRIICLAERTFCAKIGDEDSSLRLLGFSVEMTCAMVDGVRSK